MKRLAVAAAAALWVIGVAGIADAQQFYGTPGSPEAATTIDGR